MSGTSVSKKLLLLPLLLLFQLDHRIVLSGQEPQAKLSVDVRMVEVYASVYDAKGRRVQDLKQDEFEVAEDGVPQSVKVFESQMSSLSLAILVDTTGSMVHNLPQVKNSVTDLLELLSPNDEVALFDFSTRLHVLTPFTKDRSSIVTALMKTNAEGGTALYDALSQLARNLSQTGGKKAILLFTDGLDNGSVLTLQGGANAIRRIGVPIYTVAQGQILQDAASMSHLKAIATTTNGIAFEARSPGAFKDIMMKVVEDLDHLYLLGYYSSNADPAVPWRRISVRLPAHPEFKLRAKDGYWR